MIKVNSFSNRVDTSPRTATHYFETISSLTPQHRKAGKMWKHSTRRLFPRRASKLMKTRGPTLVARCYDATEAVRRASKAGPGVTPRPRFIPGPRLRPGTRWERPSCCRVQRGSHADHGGRRGCHGHTHRRGLASRWFGGLLCLFLLFCSRLLPGCFFLFLSRRLLLSGFFYRLPLFRGFFLRCFFPLLFAGFLAFSWLPWSFLFKVVAKEPGRNRPDYPTAGPDRSGPTD